MADVPARGGESCSTIKEKEGHLRLDLKPTLGHVPLDHVAVKSWISPPTDDDVTRLARVRARQLVRDALAQEIAEHACSASSRLDLTDNATASSSTLR